MTADSRIEVLEKLVTEQGEKINELAHMLIRAEGSEAVYRAAILSLLATTQSGERLDVELAKRLFSLEATTISSAETQGELDGFEEARDVIEEVRAQAVAEVTGPTSVS